MTERRGNMSSVRDWVLLLMAVAQVSLLFPPVLAQDAWACKWGFEWSSRSGNARIVRSVDQVFDATMHQAGSELRWAMVGRTNADRELRITSAVLSGTPVEVNVVTLVWDNGQRTELGRILFEEGPERVENGATWNCAWSYFQLPPAVWDMLTSRSIASVMLQTATGVRTMALNTGLSANLKKAAECVDAAVPRYGKTATTDTPPPVAKDHGKAAREGQVEGEERYVDPRSNAGEPKIVLSKVYSDTTGSADEPVFAVEMSGRTSGVDASTLPMSDGGSAGPVNSEVLPWATQRLIAVPRGKVRLRTGERSALAVLHAFSDPMQLDTFKIVTTAAQPPAYILEIVAHNGRLLYKEEILPSGFERARPGEEQRQMELDRLRAEAILGPWSFGRPMPTELYLRSIDRERNGQLFSVSKEEAAALVQDPQAVTFSYFAEPDLPRLLTYSKMQGKLVDLMPTYP